MWNGTKTLAEAIAEGVQSVDSDVEVKVYNLAKMDDNDLVVEIFKSKTVVMGSPTVGGNMLHSLAGFIHFVKEMKFKGKKAASFGCYGWSGESPKLISEALEKGGFEIIDDPLRNSWNPDKDKLQLASEFGQKIAKA